MNAKLGQRRQRGVEAIVGVSDWANWVRAEILRVAAYDSGILITGPSGTGKELVARALHAHGRRADGPLVPVDCAALVGELATSQIFGHCKGAFTGAHYSAVGAFRAASGGTLFLDEVGELEPIVQAKLLRVLQERVVVPLGSHEGQPVDVRVIAATNRDLHEEVRAGRFREDLFYRLNVISLRTVPLAERPEDIEPLAAHFLSKLAVEAGVPLKSLAVSTLDLLTRYDWPGNVRELNNQLERAAICTPGGVLLPNHLPEIVHAVCSVPAACDDFSPAPSYDNLSDPSDSPLAASASRRRPATLAEVERRHILEALEYTAYNQCAAARLLDLNRHALRRKMKLHDLDTTRSRRGRPPGDGEGGGIGD
ncbi:MAG: sigma-54-dependent Fis family transcriptional regulator [Pirellulales bacterium]|nr:sigma-54-dependent Fis family transcriptional regulator [Pirellulales bacterium]